MPGLAWAGIACHATVIWGDRDHGIRTGLIHLMSDETRSVSPYQGNRDIVFIPKREIVSTHVCIITPKQKVLFYIS